MTRIFAFQIFGRIDRAIRHVEAPLTGIVISQSDKAKFCSRVVDAVHDFRIFHDRVEMLFAVEDVRHSENRVIFRETFQCGTADFREVDSASLCQFNQFGFAAELPIRKYSTTTSPSG